MNAWMSSHAEYSLQTTRARTPDTMNSLNEQIHSKNRRVYIFNNLCGCDLSIDRKTEVHCTIIDANRCVEKCATWFIRNCFFVVANENQARTRTQTYMLKRKHLHTLLYAIECTCARTRTRAHTTRTYLHAHIFMCAGVPALTRTTCSQTSRILRLAAVIITQYGWTKIFVRARLAAV